MSFSPESLADSIREFLPDFHMTYKPDFRNTIARSWPRSIDDSKARQDWGWKPDYDLRKMTEDMLETLSKRIGGERK